MVILDTNVLISGVFFGGWPYRILEAWRDGRVEVVVSEGILEEYQEVGRRLGREFPGVDARPFLELLSVAAKLYRAPSLLAPVCEHADDDNLLACALPGERDEGHRQWGPSAAEDIRVSWHRGAEPSAIRREASTT